MVVAALTSDRVVVRAGEDLEVRPPADGSLGVGGVVSRFEQAVDGGWVTRYKLLSSWREGVEPGCFLPEERFWVTAVGLGGPVVVRIPPVEPGRYRVARDYVLVVGDEPVRTTAVVEVTVA